MSRHHATNAVCTQESQPTCEVCERSRLYLLKAELRQPFHALHHIRCAIALSMACREFHVASKAKGNAVRPSTSLHVRGSLCKMGRFTQIMKYWLQDSALGRSPGMNMTNGAVVLAMH